MCYFLPIFRGSPQYSGEPPNILPIFHGISIFCGILKFSSNLYPQGSVIGIKFPVSNSKSCGGYPLRLEEISNISRNIDIPWNIGEFPGILGGAPEYWRNIWSSRVFQNVNDIFRNRLSMKHDNCMKTNLLLWIFLWDNLLKHLSIFIPIITGRQYWQLRRDARKRKLKEKMCI